MPESVGVVSNLTVGLFESHSTRVPEGARAIPPRGLSLRSIRVRSGRLPGGMDRQPIALLQIPFDVRAVLQAHRHPDAVLAARVVYERGGVAEADPGLAELHPVHECVARRPALEREAEHSPEPGPLREGGNPQGLVRTRMRERGDGERDGIVIGSLLASYSHLRDVEGCRWAQRFVSYVRGHKGRPLEE